MQHCPSVLIVDDDPTQRRLMEMIAELIEIEPVIVENAEEALLAFLEIRKLGHKLEYGRLFAQTVHARRQGCND